jgi:hypothetical protein
LVAAGVAGVALIAPPSAAHTFTVDSRVSIGYGSGAFSGRVNSSEGFCERWRVVKLYKFSGGTYKVVKKDKTNREGRWRISYSDPGWGTFYALAVYKRKTTDGHAHRCRKAQSDYWS